MGRVDDINEMIFLTKNRERLMSIDEHIIYNYLFELRLLKLTPDERIEILKLREQLTKMLKEWE